MKKKIKINLQHYEIRLHDLGRLSDNFGTTIFDNNTINIDKTIVHEKQEQVLAHEIIHALAEESGVNEILKDREEEFVRSLESTFYSFLKENTDFYD